MALDQHAANLITTTVNAFNGDVTTVSPMDGISLIDLTEQVTQLASTADTDSKPELTTLSAALHGFSQQVGSAGKQMNTGGQAPMTSSVGGESTNSGTGASALDLSDDDLSDRNGGTIR